MIDLLIAHTLRVILILMLILIGCRSVHAQAKVEVFTTVDGKRFNRQQRDSIEQLGNFIGVKEKHWRGDTLIYSIFYYDKSLLLTPFQKQYIDKPFPDFKLLSLEEEWIAATQLKGKVTLLYVCVNNVYAEDDLLSELNDLKEKYGERVHFVALFKEEPDEVIARMKRFGLNYKLLPAKSFIEKLNLQEDSWFIIDANGVVKYAERGVPVDMSVKPDGTPRGADDPFKILVYEWYGERLEKLLAAK